MKGRIDRLERRIASIANVDVASQLQKALAQRRIAGRVDVVGRWAANPIDPTKSRFATKLFAARQRLICFRQRENADGGAQEIGMTCD